MQEGKFKEAANVFLEILKGEHLNLPARAGLGMAYIKLQKFDEAIRHLSMAITLGPRQAQLYSERAVAYLMSNKNSEAIADFDTALELEPKNPYRYSSRAFARDRTGDTLGAVRDYQKAIELDPEDAIAHNNLGLIQEKMGYGEQAKENFSKADFLEGRSLPDNESTPEPLAPQPPPKENLSPKLSLKDYGTVLKSVLTTREGFREFIAFLLKNKK